MEHDDRDPFRDPYAAEPARTPTALERPAGTQPGPSPAGPVQEPRGPLRRLGGAIVAVALAAWKVVPFLLAGLGKIKFVTTGLSFLVSVGAYALLWGWRFALGFTVLLFVHEMGHVLQLRREGVPASAPLFIPFMGAVVGMKRLPDSAWAEAKVGLAGPVLGSLGGAVTLAAAVALDNDLLRALAYTAFLLNLFNLIPVLPLDGGRAAAVFHPAVWLLGVFMIAFLYFWHPNPILLVVLVFGGLEFWGRWRNRHTLEARAYARVTAAQRVAVVGVYALLVVGLVAGMETSYLHRTI